MPLAAGYAIGRIGCQLSGDGDYGKPWDGPWAMAYPNGTVPTTDDGPPDADLRDDRDGLLALRAVALARPLAAGHAVRALPRCSPALERFLVEFCAATTDVRRSGLTQPQLLVAA